MTVKWSDTGTFVPTTPMVATNVLVGLTAAAGTNASWTAAVLKTYTSLSPTLVTPTLGVATATSINKVTITAPATSATLTVADGKTITASNTLTLAGTDGTTMTFPTTSATVARTDAANTFTGAQTVSGVAANTTPIVVSGGSITGTSTVSPGITIAGTINTSGNVTGAALYADITKTAAGSTWTLFDFRVGGVTKLRFEPEFTGAGALYLGTGNGANDPYIAAYASGVLGGKAIAIGTDSNGGIFIRGGNSGVSVAQGLGFQGATTPDAVIGRQAAGQIGAYDGVGLSNFRDFIARSFVAAGTSATAAAAGQISTSGGTQSTVGAAGGASAPPATPTGYWKINVAGTAMVVPYYAAS